MDPPAAPGQGRLRRTLVILDPQSVWRAGLVVIGLIVAYSFGSFVLHASRLDETLWEVTVLPL